MNIPFPCNRSSTLYNKFTFPTKAYTKKALDMVEVWRPEAVITSYVTRYGFHFNASGKRGETAAMPLTNLTSIQQRPILRLRIVGKLNAEWKCFLLHRIR